MVRLAFFIFGLLGVSPVLGQGDKSQATTSINMDEMLSKASALTSAFPGGFTMTPLPFVTPGGNLVKPPDSVVAAIITGVPASVVADLTQPSLRSSIAAEFKAGNTPAWYENLPQAVKDYVKNMKSQIDGGSVNLSATPTKVSETVGDSSDGEADSTSTSSALAPRSTGEVLVRFAAVLGVLGTALVL